MATSSSSALAVIPSRDISISRDVTMADEEPEVYTVPKFVAEVYEKTKEQLRVFATQLANTEEMARLSQQQQEAIKGYHYRLEQNLAEISLDARIQNNELANFSQNRYNGLLRQCSMFEAQVQADMAILSGSTDELKLAVENLAKSQKELYEAAENSHQTLGGQISDTAEEVKREKRVRRKMETELREKAEEERIRYERELAMAHNRVAEEREDRLAAARKARQETARLEEELKKLKDNQRRIAKGKKPEVSTEGDEEDVEEIPRPTITARWEPGMEYAQNPFASPPPRRSVSSSLSPPPVEVEKKDQVVLKKSELERLIAREVAKASRGSPGLATQTLRLASRPKRKEPPVYKGEPQGFRTWWEAVREHLQYITEDFENDDQKIAWVGGLLADKAERWHQGRKRQMETLGVPDVWASYEQGLKTAFVDQFEAEELVQQMRKLEYKGDIQDYMMRMKFFNSRVGLTGMLWREALLEKIGREMFTRLSLGSVLQPETDADLESRILQIGRGLEQSIRQSKALGLPTPMLYDNRGEGGKKDRKGDKYTPSSATAGPSGTNAGKKDEGKKPERSAMKGSRPKASDTDQKKEVRWKNEDEACEGVPHDMRDKRGEKGLCKRCGYDNHQWRKCLASHPYSGAIENSPELRKKRAEQKRSARPLRPKRERPTTAIPKLKRKPRRLKLLRSPFGTDGSMSRTRMSTKTCRIFEREP
jgi:hypothetical protein